MLSTRIRAQTSGRVSLQRTNDFLIFDIAQQTFFWERNFPGHPYAQPVEGTREGVCGSIHRGDLRTFVRGELARQMKKTDCRQLGR